MLRKTRLEKRKLRVRKNITGTVEKPRLSVFRSNKYIYCQLIDDVTGKTLAAASSDSKELEGKAKKDAAFETGKLLAERAKEAKIKLAVFDRNGYQYAGRVQRLAEGVREGGITL